MGKLGTEMAKRNIQKASKTAWLSYNRNKEKRRIVRETSPLLHGLFKQTTFQLENLE
jgi:hypothetical protein